ncbi:MAG: putative selenate ABC transporter substrate-binding protein [Gammaproteobacteria bacterium]|nr:putative selenate ABC transporter substrate-binding protein [Gammaproteobacteria bacterium]MBQ0773144.1 putative selenate ABC transporter substrate-binding protein [Gammaproteobacteria bacterium]|tara:strand:+ start:201903 stop:202766 length:864 start_codon:yes stop_codon:yes gene_type:complete
MYKHLAVSLLALVLVACGQPEKPTFTFTAIPDQDEARLIERFGNVADYLSKELGVEVKYIPVKSYAAAVTAFRNNEVQLAWFGGLTGVQARLQVPDSSAIAQGYEDQFFVSYFIAHNSTGLSENNEFPQDIAGKSFTFGSKGSTSGRLMPEFFIRESLGDAPDNAFSRVGFSGDHSATIALVQSGAYEVGAVNYKVWEDELAQGKIDTSKVSVIWKTPEYLDYHWVIRGDTDSHWGKGFSDKVQATLLGINDPEILAAFPRSSFVAANNDDYQAILETAQSIGLLDQ